MGKESRKFNVCIALDTGYIRRISTGFSSLQAARNFATTLTGQEVALIRTISGDSFTFAQTERLVLNAIDRKSSRYHKAITRILSNANFDGNCFTFIRTMKQQGKI